MGAGEPSVAVVVIASGETELIAGRLEGVVADLALVDALARVHLAARRLGCSIRLRDASCELRELIDLAGLSGLLLEPSRQPEGGEQLGVEEVVERGDAPA
jgi:hypothetical protein